MFTALKEAFPGLTEVTALEKLNKLKDHNKRITGDMMDGMKAVKQMEVEHDKYNADQLRDTFQRQEDHQNE